MEQLLDYFDETEDKLMAERKEILNHFREERNILISLLDDNLSATRQLRCLKGIAIEKLVDSIEVLECEDEDEYEVGFGDDEDDEDDACDEDECCTSGAVNECCEGECACEEDEEEVTEDVDATT
jgi:hypothetical protein